jgi:hypothetical protein
MKMPNRFAALKNVHDSVDINKAKGKIKENNKILAKDSLGLYERKQHTAWFDDELSNFLDQRKQAKMH